MPGGNDQRTPQEKIQDQVRLEAVYRFCLSALEYGRCRRWSTDIPLLADRICIREGKPAVSSDGAGEIVPSNFASQQLFLRTLVGLSRLTGEARFADAAREAVACHFHSLRSPCGLFYWGTNCFIDLVSRTPQAEDSYTHTLQLHLPFYEWMWQVDRTETMRLVSAMWKAHVTNWRRLEIMGEAPYQAQRNPPWHHDYAPEDSVGRIPASLLPAAVELIYAAALVARLGGEELLKRWAKRLFSVLDLDGLGADSTSYLHGVFALLELGAWLPEPLFPKRCLASLASNPQPGAGRGEEGGLLLLVYTAAYSACSEDVFWSAVCRLGQALDLGDLGTGGGGGAYLNLNHSCCDPYALLALIRLAGDTGVRTYLDAARRIGSNILCRSFYRGFFLPGNDAQYCHLNRLEPLALLALEAALRQEPEAVPAYWGGRTADAEDMSI